MSLQQLKRGAKGKASAEESLHFIKQKVVQEHDALISRYIQQVHHGDVDYNAADAIEQFGAICEELYTALVQLQQKAEESLRSLHREVGSSIHDGRDHLLDWFSFNRSVLLFKFGRYAEAYDLLLPIFQELRTYDDISESHSGNNAGLALGVCFLLLDCIFQQWQARQHVALASDILAHIEKRLLSPVATENSMMTASDLSISLYIYRARYNIVVRALDLALKDVEHVLQIQEDHPVALLLKARIATIRLQCVETVAEYLSASRTQIPECVFWNNMGLLQMRAGNLGIAGLHFRMALRSSIANTTDDRTSLQKTPHGVHRSACDFNMHLCFNAGVQQLQKGRPESAFRLLQFALHGGMHNNPRLWIRLAECCIAAHRAGDEESNAPHNQTFWPTVVKDSCGRPIRLVLSTQKINQSLQRTDSRSRTLTTMHPTEHHPLLLPPDMNTGCSDTPLSLSLSTADLCLRNAMVLLARTERPSRDSNLLQNHVLLKQAYVALSSSNPTIALACSKKVLLSDSSRTMKITSLCYAAEALCVLNRGSEFLFLLSTEDLQRILSDDTDQSISQPGHDQEVKSRRARESLYVNIVIVHILQRQYQRAQEIIDRHLCPVSASDIAYRVHLLQIYLFLAQGQERDCLLYVERSRIDH